MSNTITKYSRILLALILLISGVLKGLDPVGFSYKITEYFNVFGISGEKAASTIMAILMCSVEIFAGIMLALNVLRRLTAILSLLIFAGFSLMMGYIYFSPGVTINYCGCFGELIDIPIGYTLVKNILLTLIASIYLYGVLKMQSERYGKHTGRVVFYTVCLSCIFPLYSYAFLPPLEFTSYNIGNYVKGNEDFRIYDKEYNDVTDSLLSNTKPNYIIIAKDEFTPSNRRRILKLIDSHNRGEINLFVVTSGEAKVENSITLGGKMMSNAYIADNLLLKTMIRTPKGVVVIDDSEIVGKYTINSYLLFPIASGSTIFTIELVKVGLLLLLIAVSVWYIFKKKERCADSKVVKINDAKTGSK
ncbi:hypothetical protein BN938_2684 [Mucinivorans hirudinis]|uniref:Methylamine utilisation protein MauE domain-containing protein n=1 Tax=Mucinivorans hirudinis TaxID=1433126 RepID=A0A060RE34_9BACT|nr:hypothetical protein BN938_2684 [Mucinivorans hirudinis]